MATRFIHKALATAALGIALTLLLAATPSQGVTTTILTGPVALDPFHVMSNNPEHTAVIGTRGPSHVYFVSNVIVPGGHTGWHSHPGVSFVTIRSGTATEYHGDDPTPHVYSAGTGFVEEAGRVHLIRNEGTTPLELIAFQLIPFGAVRRIDEPAPY
jgi:quercetin dioxygenase-like cupin family protein